MAETNLGERGLESVWQKVTEKLDVYKDAGHHILLNKEPFAIAIVTLIM